MEQSSIITKWWTQIYKETTYTSWRSEVAKLCGIDPENWLSDKSLQNSSVLKINNNLEAHKRLEK